jgi:predicted amidophosphoribosyltransferase
MSGFWEWCGNAVAEPLLSVLFPPRCVGCGEFETYLCPRCRQALQAIGPDACPRCGEPGPRALVAGRCSSCLGLEVAFTGARSAFVHAGPAQRLVLGLKAGDQRVLGRTMARLAGPAFAALLALTPSPKNTLVTWVPCHRTVQRRRGYNQAEVLARELVAGVPGLLSAGLVRKRFQTREQKGLDRAGRRGNLRGVFALDENAVSALDGRPQSIVLVDDVLTTGATAQEVSQVLADGLGLPVYVFTFSRAVKGQFEGHD